MSTRTKLPHETWSECWSATYRPWPWPAVSTARPPGDSEPVALLVTLLQHVYRLDGFAFIHIWLQLHARLALLGVGEGVFSPLIASLFCVVVTKLISAPVPNPGIKIMGWRGGWGRNCSSCFENTTNIQSVILYSSLDFASFMILHQLNEHPCSGRTLSNVH